EALVAAPLSHAGSSLRVQVRRALERRAAELRRRAERRLRAAAAMLERRGWQVSLRLRSGDPLSELLGEARRSRAEVLVAGALNQSSLPVVVAR
ncbi:MAG TPA: hypothetical protein VE935_14560, partial [Burkholderiales bacterium]|nr:hypothetical protein [Burkholderiales bacterium]